MGRSGWSLWIENVMASMLVTQDGCTTCQHFAEKRAKNIFKHIFLDYFFLLKFYIWQFFHKVLIDNKSALFQVMYGSALIQVLAWFQTGPRPLRELMGTHFTEAYTSLGVSEFSRTVLIRCDSVMKLTIWPKRSFFLILTLNWCIYIVMCMNNGLSPMQYCDINKIDANLSLTSLHMTIFKGIYNSKI